MLKNRLKRLENKLEGVGLKTVIVFGVAPEEEWIYEDQRYLNEHRMSFEIYSCPLDLMEKVSEAPTLSTLRRVAEKEGFNLVVLP